MKKTTKLIAILLSAAISAGGIVPVMAADSEKTAKREYVVSEFVQSVGRNNLTINTAQEDTILSAFKDNDTIDEKYREDIARAKAYSLVAGYEDMQSAYFGRTVRRLRTRSPLTSDWQRE